MTLLKTVNATRRSIMRSLTRGLGKSSLGGSSISSLSDIKSILICRPNHRLGNQLLITPLLAEVAEVLPHAKVDLFVKGTIAPILFREYPNVRRIIMLPKRPGKHLMSYLGAWLAIRRTRYDLVINVVNHSSSGKIAARTANARIRFLGEIDDDTISRHHDHKHMAKYPVYSFRNLMRRLGFALPDKTVGALDLRVTPEELVRGRNILHDLVRNDKRTIAVYTYATGVKCHDPAWWEGLYEKLLEEFPEYNIIEILPVENISQIDFRAPSYYSKDLREIASVMKHVDVLIAADSGMMHLGSAAGIPVIGLFKSDNMPVYEPYARGSTGVRTDKSAQSDIISMVKRAITNAAITERA